MNHIYNIIFNHALGLYQVVSEHTRSKSRAQKRLCLLTDALCIARKDNAAFPKIRPLALALLTACLINLSAYGQELPVFDTDVPSEVTTAASDLNAAINAYAKLPTPANKTALDTAQVDFDAAFDAASAAGAISHKKISTDTVYDGQNTASKRLEVSGKAGHISLDSGASLTWLNSQGDANQGSYGGALHINSGAVVKLSAPTTNAQETYLFSGNKATSSSYYDAYGGAIYNAYGGTLTFGSAAFTNNSAVSSGYNPNFGPGSAGAYGGAIYNTGTLMLGSATFTDNSVSSSITHGGAIYNAYGGTMVLNNADFTNNSAVSSGYDSSPDSAVAAYGGAIDNRGTLMLGNVTFSSNSASATGKKAEAYGGAIYNEIGTIALNVDADMTSLFTGNITSTKQGTDPNPTIAASSIYMRDNSTLNVDIAEGGVLDMRDPMGGRAGLQAHTKISQQGSGVWKLGGQNIFTQVSQGKTTFAVDKGTLYLYRAGEVANGNSVNSSATVGAGSIQLDGADSSFTLGSGAKLTAGGGNAITTAGNITLHGGSTLGFDVAYATAEDVPTRGNAVLNLNAAKGLNITGGGKLNIDLQDMAASNGKYTLLVNGSTGGDDFSAANVNSDLTLKGQSTKLNTRLTPLTLTINKDSLVLTQIAITNALATWTNAASGGVWDIISDNWSLINESGAAMPETQFISGDIVNFDGSVTGGNITINEGGVVAAAIYLSGTEDYVFSGGGLTTDNTTSTLKDKTAASSKLVLGAVAKADGSIDKNQSFSGILDLTKIIGTNSFAQGIDLYSGTLKVKSADQLGTSLNQLSFLSDVSGAVNMATTDLTTAIKAYATTPNATNKNALADKQTAFDSAFDKGSTEGEIGTLQISGDIVLEGANGDSQRLEIAPDTSAHITLDDGKSLTWQNSHNNQTDQDSLGGALFINKGAVVKLSALTTNPQDAYLFSGNKASSSSSSASAYAFGGAIYNLGTMVLESATFTNNSASSTSTDGDAYGGAIYNSSSSSTMVLHNASFTNNSASATGTNPKALGGAIANDGTIALNIDAGNISLFTGNITDNNGTIAASSINMWNDSTLSINIAQDGLLDMRDPMNGDAAGLINHNHIQISQQGAGTWKLGGDNVFGSSTSGLDTGKTTFAVNEGTLYLYRTGEVENANSYDTKAIVGAGRIQLDGADSSFTLGGANADATLVASGGNAITTGGTIELNAGNNTTLSFGLTGAIAEGVPTSNNAILNLNAAKDFSITGGGKLNIDLQDMAASNGKYTLLYNGSTVGDDFSAANVNSDLTLRGQSVASNSRLDNLGLEINDKSLVLSQNHVNALATWTNAASDGVWDILSENWHLVGEDGAVMPETQFISGDAVLFNDIGGNQTITVHSGGVTPAGMVVNSNHNYTFNGGEIILSPTSTLGTALATGYLEKQGAGTLTFNNQVTGDGHIYGGTMIIGDSAHNNARFSGNVDLYSGATLGGHGQIAGMVTAQSGATIAPGNSIGTLSVGAIIFQSGSTYEFEGNTDGSGDKIIASNLLGGGTALINSGVNLSILAGAGTWNASTTYSILEANNGVQGQFDHIQTNLSFLTPSLDYSDPNKIGLTLSRNTVGFNHVGRTFNQRNTGLGIQSLSAGHPVYNQIVSMNNEQAQSAFDNLSGEIHASIKSAALNNSRYTRNAINQHLTLNAGEAPEAERNLWVNTWYHDGHLKGDGNAQKLDNKGFGIMMGVDALSYGATTLGVALGYEQAELKLGGSQSSSADMDSMHLMAYGRTKAGPIDIRGAIGYSLLNIESKRNIGVGSLIGTNRADYDGSLIQAYIEGSHTFKAAKNIDITPYINLAYQRVKTDSFTESAGLYSLGSQLKHKGRSDSQTSTTLGVRGLWRINNISDLYADIGWQHTFGRQTPESTFNFIGGQPYRIKGVKTNRNAAVLGIGANFQLTPNMQLSFGYEGHLGNQSRDHSAKLQWRLSF